MKKLLVLACFGMLIGAASGCRVCECWREAWNSRFHPQQQQAVVVSEPCVVTDSCCTPCAPTASPCTSGCGASTTAPMIVPGPVPVR